MVAFESLCMVSYLHFVATMAVSLAVYEIFSVKEWRDLENWVMGCSMSLKIAPFDRLCTTFYWSVVVNVLFLSYVTLNNIETLKSLKVI